jgi:hypothetical protein
MDFCEFWVVIGCAKNKCRMDRTLIRGKFQLEIHQPNPGIVDCNAVSGICRVIE